MPKDVSRRDFIKVAGATLAVAAVGANVAKGGRGTLHFHSHTQANLRGG